MVQIKDMRERERGSERAGSVLSKRERERERERGTIDYLLSLIQLFLNCVCSARIGEPCLSFRSLDYQEINLPDVSNFKLLDIFRTVKSFIEL